ncbi:uncharacterized protein LOC134710384 [Mytilus trossulus]|uniref:uncharacterized protein LOC134710384 n=1 Tax=Mytilus trossulus TaxID=6551 RepID=UPI0030054091
MNHHTSLCNSRPTNNIKPVNEVNHRNGSSNSANTNFHANYNQSSNPSNPPSTNVQLVNELHDTEEDTTILYSQSTESRSNVLLKTAVSQVGSNQHFIDTNILFDEGAQRSFLTQNLANKLNLQIEGTEIIHLSAFGGEEKNTRHLEKTTIYLKTDAGHVLPIKVLIVPMIATPLHNHIRNIDTQNGYLRGLKLAHTMTQQDLFDISLLVGADHYWDIVVDHIVRGNGPTAVKSKIGYLLSGPTYSTKTNTSKTNMFNVLISHKDEEYNLERFWNLESIGINSKELDEDEDDDTYITAYQDRSIEFRENKYFARLPWKQDHDELPTNLAVTKRRTENVIKRLTQNPDMLKKYGNIIQEQERREFIERVDETAETQGIIHYIPHHPVQKESSTTPIRIVYDCSCRQSPYSPSLNDCLLDTPPKLNDLTKILMRFRANPVAITIDIEKAFLHVGLNEDDRDATRFLWLSNPSDPTSNLQTYRFKSVLFGATCSPFMLNDTILKHLHRYNSTTATLMERDLYVDNILTSLQNEDDANTYYKEARTMMKEAGFNLRSWTSNSENIRTLAKTENVLDKDINTKVLGMLSNSKSDDLMYQKCEIQLRDIVTKKEILKHSSKIYDPLGILSPVTIRTKMLIQDLWKSKLDWDEPVPENFKATWINVASDLEKATQIVFPRYYFSSNSTSTQFELHVFCDSSPKAYGATAYLNNGTKTTLVMAKSRVAPVKNLTLPQLELMAAVIGTRLASHVKSTFEC